MKIHYRVKNNTIEIIRCYGTDSRVVLPEEINGLPVVSAAPYAFSAHKDGEEDAETWESEDTGLKVLASLPVDETEYDGVK